MVEQGAEFGVTEREVLVRAGAVLQREGRVVARLLGGAERVRVARGAAADRGRVRKWGARPYRRNIASFVTQVLPAEEIVQNFGRVFLVHYLIHGAVVFTDYRDALLSLHERCEWLRNNSRLIPANFKPWLAEHTISSRNLRRLRHAIPDVTL